VIPASVKKNQTKIMYYACTIFIHSVFHFLFFCGGFPSRVFFFFFLSRKHYKFEVCKVCIVLFMAFIRRKTGKSKLFLAQQLLVRGVMLANRCCGSENPPPSGEPTEKAKHKDVMNDSRSAARVLPHSWNKQKKKKKKSRNDLILRLA
jgi:hypothetical protein